MNYQHFGRAFHWTPILFILVAVTGCGKKLVQVRGVVMLDNQPVEGATVAFMPVEGRGVPAQGFTGTDGIFELETYNSGDGAFPGDYEVLVTKKKEVGPPLPDDSPEPQDEAAAMGNAYRKFFMMKRKEKSLLPKVYGNLNSVQFKINIPHKELVELKMESSK